MKAEWEAEKDAIQRVQSLKATIEETRAEAERAQRDQDLQRAAELTYGELPKLQAELDAAMERLAELQAGSPMLKEEVGSEDVAEVVASWTGIPVSRLLEGEMEKLVQMESRLHERVIGQDEAVAGRVERDPAVARRPGRSRPADRLVHLPRADGRGEDRAREGARRVPVRHREGDGAHRHVGVHGEAHRLAADRRSARVRRLRRGRSAHRGRPAQAVLGAAPRRDREGAHRRVQRAPPAARRRSPDRRAGAHGRLPKHDRHHDVERNRPRGNVPAGVPEPDRRDRPLPAARPRPARRDRPPPGRGPAAPAGRAGDRRSS